MQTVSHSSRPIQGMRLRRPRHSSGSLLARRARPARATIDGTPGNDRLVGTPRADVHSRARRERPSRRGPRRRLPPRRPGAGHASTPGRETTCVATSYDGARTSVRCGAGVDVVNADLADARRTRLRARRPAALARPVHDAPTRSTRRRSSRTASRSGARRSRRSRSDAASTAPRRTSAARSRRTTGARGERPPPRPDDREPPAGPERAGQRPGRRIRRGARASG